MDSADDLFCTVCDRSQSQWKTDANYKVRMSNHMDKHRKKQVHMLKNLTYLLDQFMDILWSQLGKSSEQSKETFDIILNLEKQIKNWQSIPPVPRWTVHLHHVKVANSDFPNFEYRNYRQD